METHPGIITDFYADGMYKEVLTAPTVFPTPRFQAFLKHFNITLDEQEEQPEEDEEMPLGNVAPQTDITPSSRSNTCITTIKSSDSSTIISVLLPNQL